MTRENSIYTIKKRLSWQKMEKALKFHKEYDTQKEIELGPPCGLADGPVYYRIYTTHNPKLGTSSIHICRHLDGICIIGSLNVDKDNNLAEEAYNKLKVL